MPPQLIGTRKYLLHLLRQFDRVGGEKLEVRIVDVAPTSSSLQEARAAGVSPQTVKYASGSQQVEQEIYMGAVVTSASSEVLLPNISRDGPLEFQLSRAIATTSDHAPKLTVGILETDLHFAGLQEYDRATDATRLIDWGFDQTLNVLKKHYEVQRIAQADLKRWATAGAPPEDLLDEDLPSKSSADSTELPDVLLVAGPSTLDDSAMAALINYVQTGHPTLLLMDPLPFHWLSKAPDYFGLVYAPSQPRGNPQTGFPPPISRLPKSVLGMSTIDAETAGLSTDLTRATRVGADRFRNGFPVCKMNSIFGRYN